MRTLSLRRRVRGLCSIVLGVGVLAGREPAGAQPVTPPATPPATLRLARLFGDGAVLQRDAAIPVWGWAAPGTGVAVTLQGRTMRATADRDGAWRVAFPASGAGGPHLLTVEGGGTRLTVRDVLIGDVWLASGQSNMEWKVADAADGADVVARGHDAQLRHFKVPTTWAWEPAAELAGGEWRAADAQHVGDFTAVGYHFARELRDAVGVPIGILNTSWSGSAIEPWMSRQALGLDPAEWGAIVRAEERHQAAIRDTLRRRVGDLPGVDSGLVAGRAVWADPAYDDAAWPRLAVPGAWERSGYPGMDGVAWYRTEFTLTEREARRGARLSVGVIDDEDVTWVNGVEVGRTSGYAVPRVYEVPATALRPGRNVLAVRVVDGGGGGGILGVPAQLQLEVDGVRRPLAGAWKFRVATVALGEDAQHVNKIPTVLYNRMVHPLLPFPIRGVIWYQGESNANDEAQAVAYREQFATLIRSWRREWRGGRADFPFLWVQLPNFGAVDTVPPARATWATLRESQSAALALPNTGQAVTIDLGDPADLHPRNKRDVGHRLALVARRVAYGQSVVSSGPTYRAHTARDGRVSIEFDHADGGLVSRAPGDAVTGFAIAGADGRFVWARARIEGGRVIVWSEQVARPAAVRYAWSNSPRSPSLYNGAGLPAAPFRTDAW